MVPLLCPLLVRGRDRDGGSPKVITLVCYAPLLIMQIADKSSEPWSQGFGRRKVVGNRCVINPFLSPKRSIRCSTELDSSILLGVKCLGSPFPIQNTHLRLVGASPLLLRIGQKLVWFQSSTKSFVIPRPSSLERIMQQVTRARPEFP